MKNEFDACPALKQILEGNLDLTGRKFGKFTVIGLAENARGQWICQCECGVYAIRKAKTIQNASAVGSMCQSCQQKNDKLKSKILPPANKVDKILEEIGLPVNAAEYRPILRRKFTPKKCSSGKTIYSSESFAKSQKNFMLNKGRANTSRLRVYKCDKCYGWHMSSDLERGKYHAEFD